MFERSKRSLIVVVPSDFGPPIYYNPEDDFTLFLSQILTAVFVGARELDEEQIRFGLQSIERFLKENWDRKIAFIGSGATLILPSDLRDKEHLFSKLKNIFESIKVPLKIRYWDDFGLENNIVLFAMDLQLRSEAGLRDFIENIKSDIFRWDHKAREYLQAGLIVWERTGKSEHRAAKFMLTPA